MARRGEIKVVCADCGAEQLQHWTARARHTRDRCMSCGSARLDAKTKLGKADIRSEQINLLEGARGSVVVGKQSGLSLNKRTG